MDDNQVKESTTPSARRQRRTMHIDAQVFARLMDEAVSLALQRERAGLPLRAGGLELDWIEGQVLPLTSLTLWTRDFLAQHLRALLKAFLDAARPASGLRLDAQGLPAHLPALLAAGQRLSVEGVGAPKLERNIKAGAPVDRRLAEAVLAFFKVFLERPGLRLDEIGARESERNDAVRQIETLLRDTREDLSRLAFEGLIAKAHEGSTHAFAMTHYVIEYRKLRLVHAGHALPQIALERVTRFRPLKLVNFQREYRPSLGYECYEWARFVEASLRLTQLDARARPLESWPLLVRKHLAERSELVVFELAGEQAPGAALLLRELASAAAGEQPPCELVWCEQLLFNAADRDIIVAHCPITQLHLSFDAVANPDFHFTVGDSPGLLRDGNSWRLDRALLAREVLAVRIRWKGLSLQDAVLVETRQQIIDGRSAASLSASRQSSRLSDS